MSPCPTTMPSTRCSTGYRFGSSRNGGALACGLCPVRPTAWQRAHSRSAIMRPRFSDGCSPLNSSAAPSANISASAHHRVRIDFDGAANVVASTKRQVISSPCLDHPCPSWEGRSRRPPFSGSRRDLDRARAVLICLISSSRAVMNCSWASRCSISVYVLSSPDHLPRMRSVRVAADLRMASASLFHAGV